MILYLRIETVKNQLQTLLGTCTHTYLVHIGEYPPPSRSTANLKGLPMHSVKILGS